ncbi:ComF family protein [Oxalobacteraceae bacterium GrIS 1.11]
MCPTFPSGQGSLRQRLLQALLPAACALCGGPCAQVLCAPCQAHYIELARKRCPQCANPQEEGLPCGRCLSHPPAFDATLVAVDYAAPLDQLLLQLKFGGRLALAPLFAQLLRDAVLERPDFALPDLLCPVPLGPGRLAERGFNQALEIARPLARALGIALHPALAARVHETEAQTRVAPRQRGRNIACAFALAAPAAALVRGRHIGVVDDVITSGQTLGELAATFKRYGAARVSNLVFARTPPR